jgi:hypothetical protein
VEAADPAGNQLHVTLLRTVYLQYGRAGLLAGMIHLRHSIADKMDG